ncbi:MAG TPA: hypothetical protein VHD56_13935 [Tepidisphaeraceae bacterium]|nr:hypothetical protein [Tepidisphaeraceae bacterium]
MVRWLGKSLATIVLILGGSFAIWFYQDQTSSSRQIKKLEQEKHVLEQVVQRLSDEKRVAEVVVTNQKTVNGVLTSTLLFVEYDKAGQNLPPRTITIQGNEAHIDALVIRFNQHFVSEGDPLRGHSLALFTRIYGANQTPAEGYVIDQPGKIPDIYRSADSQASDFEQELWENFWKLADDANYRAQKGVEVANGQGVWGPFEQGKLYTITLQSHGGVSITSEPLKGIYRELLREQQSTTQSDSR